MGKRINWRSLYITASVCFIISLLLSTLARLSTFETQINIHFIWQLVSASILVAWWQGIITLPIIVKRTSHWFRLIGGLSVILASLSILAHIYKWFPHKISSCLIFLLCLVAFSLLTFTVLRLYSKHKAKEYTKQLEYFLKHNK